MSANSGILTVTIKEKAALFLAYMPFVKNGGLFIPTNRSYQLGDEVFVVLTLLEDKEKMPVAAEIIWLTPVGVQGNRAQGIGVQFSDRDNGATRNKIDGLLVGMLKTQRPTHTM